jgi:hypothetical protein
MLKELKLNHSDTDYEQLIPVTRSSKRLMFLLVLWRLMFMGIDMYLASHRPSDAENFDVSPTLLENMQTLIRKFPNFELMK